MLVREAGKPGKPGSREAGKPGSREAGEAGEAGKPGGREAGKLEAVHKTASIHRRRALSSETVRNVTADCHGHAMTTPRILQRKVLRGIELRYMLATNLSIHGAATMFEMIELLEYQGFAIPARWKTVSDALRWEIRRGRDSRLRRGLYGPGQMPRSTGGLFRNCVSAGAGGWCGGCDRRSG